MPWTLQSPFRHQPAGFQLVANPGAHRADTDADADADIEDAQKETYTARRREPTCSLTSLLLPLVLFAIVLSGYAGFRLGRGDLGLDSMCAAYTAQFSTILKDVDISYAFRPFNGSFMRETIYRQKASPAVDAAWQSLGLDSEAGVIPYDDGLKAGLTPGHVQRNEKYGGGFVVNLEGMHHLHCLNLLRKSLYFNVEYYKQLGEHAFKNEEHILQLHITHCLDTIRQVLMCNVDTGILGQVWYNQTHPKAFPDFNTQHKCKNFDDIRDWAVALQIDKSKKSPPDFLAAPLPEHVYPTMP